MMKYISEKYTTRSGDDEDTDDEDTDDEDTDDEDTHNSVSYSQDGSALSSIIAAARAALISKVKR